MDFMKKRNKKREEFQRNNLKRSIEKMKVMKMRMKVKVRVKRVMKKNLKSLKN